MKRTSRYRSTSNTFKLTYIGLLLFVAACMWWLAPDKSQRVFMLVTLILPMLPLAFIINTYYEIKKGKIIRYQLGGKITAPNLSIPVDQVGKVQLIEQRGKAVGLKIFHKDTDQQLLTMRIENAKEFLAHLKALHVGINSIY